MIQKITLSDNRHQQIRTIIRMYPDLIGWTTIECNPLHSADFSHIHT